MNMSSKPRTTESADAEVSRAEVGTLPAEYSARDEETRCRAYEIYLQRGQQAGGELDDWLHAERELDGATPRVPDEA